jgi:phosphohistidine swiveling domain-containing protein
LILENLDFELYDKLNYISWVIIKNWNSLSHNAIILREYKIPSIINYKNFWKLKIWEKIIL